MLVLNWISKEFKKLNVEGICYIFSKTNYHHDQWWKNNYKFLVDRQYKANNLFLLIALQWNLSKKKVEFKIINTKKILNISETINYNILNNTWKSYLSRCDYYVR